MWSQDMRWSDMMVMMWWSFFRTLNHILCVRREREREVWRVNAFSPFSISQNINFVWNEGNNLSSSPFLQIMMMIILMIYISPPLHSCSLCLSSLRWSMICIQFNLIRGAQVYQNRKCSEIERQKCEERDGEREKFSTANVFFRPFGVRHLSNADASYQLSFLCIGWGERMFYSSWWWDAWERKEVVPEEKIEKSKSG